jgi:mevalonate kinase
LAKHVLENIVDSFCYSGVAVGIINELMENAERMYAAFVQLEEAKNDQEGNGAEIALRKIGDELNFYKKCCVRLQGKGFLPDDIAWVVEMMERDCYGVNLMGAGNGGFLVGIMKPQASREAILKNIEGAGSKTSELKFTLTEIEAFD